MNAGKGSEYPEGFWLLEADPEFERQADSQVQAGRGQMRGPYEAEQLYILAVQGEFSSQSAVYFERQQIGSLTEWLTAYERLQAGRVPGSGERPSKRLSGAREQDVGRDVPLHLSASKQEMGELQQLRSQHHDGQLGQQRMAPLSELSIQPEAAVSGGITQRIIAQLDSEEERLLWRARPSLRGRPVWFLLVVLGWVPALFVLLGWWRIEPLFWLLPLTLSVLLLLFWQLRSRPVYLVSSLRVVLRRGRFLPTRRELLLCDLHGIDCERVGLSAWLGVANVRLQGGQGTEPLCLEHISGAGRLVRKLRQAQKRAMHS